MSSPSATPLSSFRHQSKPVNVFFVWYAELCRRLHCQPASCIRPLRPKCITVLDFTADRLKADEWGPLTNALRNDTSLHVISIRSRINKSQFLHDVDSLQKIRQVKLRCGLIYTAYVLNTLLKSLSNTVRINGVLKCLELDGIPLFTQYLEPLLKAIRMNHSLKSLSLTRCKINDVGCQLVCSHLKFVSNVEILNLSWCGLTSESGEHLAKLLKHQQINRFSEAWHNSLRYSDPTAQPMRGIKRITLNGNQFFGDNGLDPILDVLFDDLWVKAIDFQKCGITEDISQKILDLLEFNESIEIADFRNNDFIQIETLEKIVNILQKKQKEDPEFHWCESAVTLNCPSTILTGTTSRTSRSTARVLKVKSLPIKQRTGNVTSAINLRKTKTCHQVPDKNIDYFKYKEIEKKVEQLNTQLREEIQKRKEMEKVNLELREKLKELSSTDKSINELIVNMTKNATKKDNTDNMFKPTNVENGCNTINELNRDPSMIFRTMMASNNEYIEEDVELEDASSSQVSLYKFMQNLKINKYRQR